jgi:chromate transporter
LRERHVPDPPAVNDAAPPPAVSARELFVAFMKVGISGFGGVLPFARRMLVERTRWMSEREFIEVLSLSQFLPGPNIVNVSIIVGRRFHGVPGSIAATAGLLLMPLIIVLTLAAVFSRYGELPALRGATHGVSAAAAGLMLSVAFRMAQPIRRSAWQIAMAVLAFAGIGLARLPLLWVLAVLAPLAVLIAWRRRA